MQKTVNPMADMFNLDKVKSMIANCPKNEIVILCGHWSINKPKYSQADLEDMRESDDWDEFEREIDAILMVNDYDDLIADPHGIMNA